MFTHRPAADTTYGWSGLPRSVRPGSGCEWASALAADPLRTPAAGVPIGALPSTYARN